MKNLFYILLVGLITFSACKKYEEGPGISLRSKSSRLEGDWKAEEFYINGEKQEEDPNEEEHVTTFTKDGKYIQKEGQHQTEGTWEFVNDKEEIKVYMTDTSSGMTFTYDFTYKILKLKNNELWLELTIGSDKYEIHMVPA